MILKCLVLKIAWIKMTVYYLQCLPPSKSGVRIRRISFFTGECAKRSHDAWQYSNAAAYRSSLRATECDCPASLSPPNWQRMSIVSRLNKCHCKNTKSHRSPRALHRHSATPPGAIDIPANRTTDCWSCSYKYQIAYHKIIVHATQPLVWFFYKRWSQQYWDISKNNIIIL